MWMITKRDLCDHVAISANLKLQIFRWVDLKRELGHAVFPLAFDSPSRASPLQEEVIKLLCVWAAWGGTFICVTRWNILTLPRFSHFKDSPERGGVGLGQQISGKKWKERRRQNEWEWERWRWLLLEMSELTAAETRNNLVSLKLFKMQTCNPKPTYQIVCQLHRWGCSKNIIWDLLEPWHFLFLSIKDH